MDKKTQNRKIAKYIWSWIESFDGDGLVITDPEEIQNTLKIISSEGFQTLRDILSAEITD